MIPGIYLLIKNHNVVYVGSTCQFKERIKIHLRERKKDFDRYHFFRCNAENLLWFEEELIDRFRPIYNKAKKCSNWSSIQSQIKQEIDNLKFKIAEEDYGLTFKQMSLETFKKIKSWDGFQDLSF